MPLPPRTGRRAACPTWAFQPRLSVVYRAEILPLAVVPAPVQEKNVPVSDQTCHASDDVLGREGATAYAKPVDRRRPSPSR